MQSFLPTRFLIREQADLVLRRWGYTDDEIVNMDPFQRTSELADALTSGICVAPERGALERPSWSSFKDSLERFKREHGGKLDSADQEHLGRWSEWIASNLWEGNWNTIQTKARKGRSGVYAESGFFISYVLQIRRIAESINEEHLERPRHLMHAAQAESLVKFLRQVGRIQTPEPIDLQLCELLELRAREWRNPSEVYTFFGPIRVSRNNREGSRQRIAFMNAMSSYMEDVCGQPLDNVVATLSDIAFWPRTTTIDEVQSARKPTTRSGRSNRRKAGRRPT
jgi:hypothetical protein